MKDYLKLNLILTGAILPCFLFVLWFIVSSCSLTPFRMISFFEILWGILSYVFAVIVIAFHPRARHWRKVISEFEDNYRYVKEAK